MQPRDAMQVPDQNIAEPVPIYHNLFLQTYPVHFQILGTSYLYLTYSYPSLYIGLT